MAKKKEGKFPGRKRRSPNPKPQKKRAHTPPLPGMEDHRIEAVTNLALSYVDASERAKAGALVKSEARDELIAATKEAGLAVYRDSESGIFVRVEESEKVKVLIGDATAKESGGDDRPVGEGTMETEVAPGEPE